MLHGINNTFLYSAKKIVVVWVHETDAVELRGTGFFIDKDSELILVTNRHVVEPGYSDAKYKEYQIKSIRFESLDFENTNPPTPKLSVAHIQNWNEFVFHSNPHNDIACLKSVHVDNLLAVSFAIPYSMLATDEWLQNKLSVCDSLAYPGFPDWFDKQNNTPIFRMGTIASDPRLNYSCYPGEPIASRIAYEGFSTGGASGSPVFAIQRGFPTDDGISAPADFYREVKLIGINAGHFKDQDGHSGISYLYKSSAIHDIIDSM